MSCKDFEELIALDIAGDLPASDVAQVQKHLSQCKACREFAAELSTDLEWLQSAHQEAPDPAALHQVRVGVMRQLESEQSRWTPPFGGLAAYGWRWQWVIAAAVAILLGSLTWWNVSLERPQDAVAVGSQDRDQQHPGIENVPFERPAESTMAKVDPPAQTNKSAGGAATSSATARRELDPGRVRESDVPDQSADRPYEATKDLVPEPQMASLTPHQAQPVHKPEPSFESLDSERKVEIVTARLEEPQQAPEEAVMLKIPTSNPNIVVYWLMDDEQQPEQAEENKGD